MTSTRDCLLANQDMHNAVGHKLLLGEISLCFSCFVDGDEFSIQSSCDVVYTEKLLGLAFHCKWGRKRGGVGG